MARSCVEVPMVWGETWESNEFPALCIGMPAWRHSVAGAHSERKHARGLRHMAECPSQSQMSTPKKIYIFKFIYLSPLRRNAPVSQLRVKRCLVPLKTSDKKPIWSPSSNHQFLLQKQPLHFCPSECYSSTGGKRLRIRQKLKKCDNSTALFMAQGKLVRKELFWHSFEPRNAGSKW